MTEVEEILKWCFNKLSAREAEGRGEDFPKNVEERIFYFSEEVAKVTTRSKERKCSKFTV